MEPVKRDMELLSNSMATYAHIKANPESFALYFMMGVCFGLLMALCLLVAGIACKSRRQSRPPPSPERRQLKESSEEEEEEEEEGEEEESITGRRRGGGGDPQSDSGAHERAQQPVERYAEECERVRFG
uniref:EVA1 domain-containing protein n=1 Tax=Lates calcarifer TaxID=8187 RepID=A0A4W6C9X2_LATCA